MPAIIIHGGAGKLSDPDSHKKGIKEALEIGWQYLSQGYAALDAVCQAVSYMEDSGIFNCGSGSTLTFDGKIELDASVMTSKGDFGAVGALKGVKNPIMVARLVMERTDHLLLVGEGAQRFAYRMGIKRYHHKIIPRQKERWLKFIKKKESEYFPKIKTYDRLGTVGAVALDDNNEMAVACSTGGILGKLSGRIGDTPIIGAGIYATERGAVCATGHGEAIIKLFLAKYVTELMIRNNAQEAVRRGIRLAQRKNAHCGIIALDYKGNIGYGYTTPSMSWGYIDKKGCMRLFT
jgi:beta-aspartyl-peptidase (threonine type)